MLKSGLSACVYNVLAWCQCTIISRCGFSEHFALPWCKSKTEVFFSVFFDHSVSESEGGCVLCGPVNNVIERDLFNVED